MHQQDNMSHSGKSIELSSSFAQKVFWVINKLIVTFIPAIHFRVEILLNRRNTRNQYKHMGQYTKANI